MGRAPLFAIVLSALACGSSSSGGSQHVFPPPLDAGDAGPTDGGPVDAGPVDAGPLGGGDWGQYRHDQGGRSENAGVFEAAEVANLTDLWNHDLASSLGVPALYVYTQAVVAE